VSPLNETKDPTLTDGKGGASFLGSLWASVAVTLILGILCCGVYPLVVWAIAQTVFPHQANGSLIKKDGSKSKNDTDVVGSSLIGQVFTDPSYFHPRPSAANNSPGSSYSPTGGYDPTASGGSNFGPLSDELINGLNSPATPTTGPAAAAVTTAPTTTVAIATTQPGMALQYDGIRLRTIHYALDNGLSFKLYNVKPDGTKTEAPLAMYIDPASGSPLDVALVDAFPHPSSDPADKVVLIAADFKKPDGTAVMIPADAVTASGSGLDPHISPANAALQAQRVADKRNISLKEVRDMIEEYTDKPDLGILGDPGVNVLRLNLALDAKHPVPAAPTSAPAK
jgi:K+-transporting ATPase ATPase C chain